MVHLQQQFDINVSKTAIINDLFEAGCVKFGSFLLKGGDKCPFYIDMRELSMSPVLFNQIAEYASQMVLKTDSITDESTKLAIVGVPYGAVPLASVVANKLKLAYYPVRKETKGYGRTIAASSYSSYSFVLIEDVITTGSSIEETIQKLDDRVAQICVLVNREQGGIEILRARYPNVKVDYMFKICEIIKTLADCGKVDAQTLTNSLNWISSHSKVK